MSLSKLRDKVRRDAARVAKREQAYETAKRGQKTEARKALTEAKRLLRESEKAYTAAVEKKRREEEKREEKARELADRARKAREELKRHLDEDWRLRRAEIEAWEKEQERLRDAEALKRREEEEKARAEEEKRKAEEKRESLFQDDVLPDVQAGVSEWTGLAQWLEDHGWNIYLYGDGQFDGELSVQVGLDEHTPLYEYKEIENVWWRTEVSISVKTEIRGMGETEGYTKRRGTDVEEGYTYGISGGTWWHASPKVLDDTVRKIIANFIAMHLPFAKPGDIIGARVAMVVAGRAQKADLPK